MCFYTMRRNCVQIHQEVYEMLLVAQNIGEYIVLPFNVTGADNLRTNPKTKAWDDMGRFAKALYDADSIWAVLPTKLRITLPDKSFRHECLTITIN